MTEKHISMPLDIKPNQQKLKNTNFIEKLNYLGRLPRKVINLTTNNAQRSQLDTGAQTRSQGIISA
jgi:hypothetical protein